MFLKTLLASIFIFLFSTSLNATEIPAQTVMVQITHMCYPTNALLDAWKKGGEVINYIGNVSPGVRNPPGQALVTINKSSKDYTILYNMQVEGQNVSCIVLHGDNFIKVN